MDKLSPDASLTQDESFTATSHKGLTYPHGDFAPAIGEVTRVGDGISWARIPMPGSLGHINTWLLDDGDDGIAIVDTGIQLGLCHDAWEALFANGLAGKHITRVICTHLHPDHIGLAGWLCEKFNVALWMTRGEWLTARMLTMDTGDASLAAYAVQQRSNGWDESEIAASLAKGWGKFFNKMVSPMPASYRRLQQGDVLDLGAHQWTIVVGSGHSPEHACLLNARAGVMISGDQILPRISSNVSVTMNEPEGDPLGDWLNSIDRLLELPDTLLICPAHGEPFYGLHNRLRALRDEHLSRLDSLAISLSNPKRAVDCFPLLFNRKIGPENRELATGEAQAHLRRLHRDGRARREMVDGVYWYHTA
jgi:glyoxylase-like metal-dependent hydrolase (beta-lactamase superfamily II)